MRPEIIDSALESLIRLQNDPIPEHLGKARVQVAALLRKAQGASNAPPDADSEGSPNLVKLEALADFSRRFGAEIKPVCYLEEYLASARLLLSFSDLLLAVETLASCIGSQTGPRGNRDHNPVIQAVLARRPPRSIWRRTDSATRHPAPCTAKNRTTIASYLRSAVPAIASFGRIIDETYSPRMPSPDCARAIICAAVESPHAAAFMGVNRYEGTLWYNREGYGDTVGWLTLLMSLKSISAGSFSGDAAAIITTTRRWISARNASGYSVTRLIHLLTDSPKATLR